MLYLIGFLVNKINFGVFNYPIEYNAKTKMFDVGNLGEFDLHKLIEEINNKIKDPTWEYYSDKFQKISADNLIKLAIHANDHRKSHSQAR